VTGVQTCALPISTGLCVADDRLLRLLRTSEQDPAAELLVYDRRGVERYCRIDELVDPHDLAWDGRELLAVSTLTNQLLWIAPSGRVTRRWQAPGQGDAWHLNCLLLRDGDVLVSAFGRHERHRQWAEHLGDPTGLVFDLATGRAIVSGLSHPHSPRYFDQAWAICNSATRELWQVDPASGLPRRRVQLDGYTRGLAVGDDLIFVGESANRASFELGQTASIAILDRDSWTLLDRLELPCREIYDLVLVRPELVEAARRGFRTNPRRVAEQDQLAMFAQVGVEPLRIWATGDPLPREACRVSIAADLPPTMAAGALIDLTCTVENLGGAFLVSAPPHPVCISYRWIDGDAPLLVDGQEGIRSVFPLAVRPAQTVSCSFKVRAPSAEGAYQLRVTLVQEGVAWFDDLDPANGCARVVQVVHSDQPDRSSVRSAGGRR